MLSDTVTPLLWLRSCVPDHDGGAHHSLHSSHFGRDGRGALHLHLLPSALQPNMHRPTHPPPDRDHPNADGCTPHHWPAHHFGQRAAQLLPNLHLLWPLTALPGHVHLLQELRVRRHLPVVCGSDAALHLLQDHAGGPSRFSGAGLSEESQEHCAASWSTGVTNTLTTEPCGWDQGLVALTSVVRLWS